jgi:predicted GIY-YIG superfamily endonuclease
LPNDIFWITVFAVTAMERSQDVDAFAGISSILKERMKTHTDRKNKNDTRLYFFISLFL